MGWNEGRSQSLGGALGRVKRSMYDRSAVWWQLQLQAHQRLAVEAWRCGGGRSRGVAGRVGAARDKEGWGSGAA